VHTLGSVAVREVTADEAQRIVENTYQDSMGGFVADYRTNQVISQISPETAEILIVEQMLGGG
jgi:hypothetical protein